MNANKIIRIGSSPFLKSSGINRQWMQINADWARFQSFLAQIGIYRHARGLKGPKSKFAIVQYRDNQRSENCRLQYQSGPLGIWPALSLAACAGENGASKRSRDSW
jgi:hypothetical protein